MANTTGENSKTRSIFGGSHLKRVSVTIQYKNHPETTVAGYALSHEILESQVSFFAPQKFPVDEELNVFFTLNGERRNLTVTMRSMHEQISSGRVMNALPTEQNPFPARKFYRCYTSVVAPQAAAKDTTEETAVGAEGTAPVEGAAPVEAGADAAAPIETVAAAETVAETAPIEAAAAPIVDNVVEMPKKPAIDPFAPDEIVSVPIPDVA